MKHTLSDTAFIAKRHGPGYWYLASPYTKYEAGKSAAFQDIAMVAARLMALDVALFCPIAHSHVVETAGKSLLSEKPEKFWLEDMDAPLMRGSVGMILACMQGWEASSGVNFELRHFAEAEKPIILLDVAGLVPDRRAKLGGGADVITMKHQDIRAGTAPRPVGAESPVPKFAYSDYLAQRNTEGQRDLTPDGRFVD